MQVFGNDPQFVAHLKSFEFQYRNFQIEADALTFEPPPGVVVSHLNPHSIGFVAVRLGNGDEGWAVSFNNGQFHRNLKWVHVVSMANGIEGLIIPDTWKPALDQQGG